MPDRRPPRDSATPGAHEPGAEPKSRTSGLPLEQLLEDVYPQLRALAGHLMRNEREGQTLQATGLL